MISLTRWAAFVALGFFLGCSNTLKTVESLVQEQAYFFNRFDTLLENKGFFTAHEKAPTVKRNMRNFFIKARFTKQELLTWHGILTLFDKQK